MAKLESREERRTGWGWGWKAWTMIFMIGVIVATLGSPFIFQLGIFNVSSHKLCFCKVKLWCDCPFWPDDGMCHLRDCSVCECPEQEFPEPFKRPESQLSEDDLVCQEGKPHSIVDRTLDRKAFRGWMETDNPWTSDNETDNAELTYVNLQLNPERYTGYTGPSARRIWESIYKDHCLKGLPGDASPERRVFYKLISGLHSSISAHIASKYLLDETKDIWGPNLSLLYERVLKYPERIGNLYFTFLFVLRAVTKPDISAIIILKVTPARYKRNNDPQGYIAYHATPVTICKCKLLKKCP